MQMTHFCAPYYVTSLTARNFRNYPATGTTFNPKSIFRRNACFDVPGTGILNVLEEFSDTL
jgi:hypothetical protein